MLIVPAIDIKSDKTVRLLKGDYARISEYSQRPQDAARSYLSAGARRLHIILLWGAREGHIDPVEEDTVGRIVAVRDELGAGRCTIQLGGGIRKYDQIDHYLDKGINYLILGTSLLIPITMESGFGLNDIKRFYQRGGKTFAPETTVPEYELIDRLDRETKNRIIVAVDYRGEEIGLSGWEVTVPLLPEYVVKKFVERGFSNFLLTNIERDGTLEGIDPDPLERILKELSTLKEKPNLLISGGVRDEEDIEYLAGLSYPRLGAVIGKALYQGQVDLKSVIKKYQRSSDAAWSSS